MECGEPRLDVWKKSGAITKKVIPTPMLSVIHRPHTSGANLETGGDGSDHSNATDGHVWWREGAVEARYMRAPTIAARASASVL